MLRRGILLLSLCAVLATPEGRGKGVFWWEPAVARRNNRAMFDDENNALPVIGAFDKFSVTFAYAEFAPGRFLPPGRIHEVIQSENDQ